MILKMKSNYIIPLFTLMFLLPTKSNSFEIGSGFNLDTNIDLLSDYRFSGVSQTQNNPALQIESMLWHESGAYIGLFSSNIDDGGDASRENMLYTGFDLYFTETSYISTYIGRYMYTGDGSQNSNEYFIGGGVQDFYIGFSYNYDQGKYIADSSAYETSYTFHTPFDSKTVIRYGYTDVNMDAFYNDNGDVRQHFSDWEVRFSKDISGLNLAISYVDTDLTETECYYALGFDDVCSSTLIGRVRYTF